MKTCGDCRYYDLKKRACARLDHVVYVAKASTGCALFAERPAKPTSELCEHGERVGGCPHCDLAKLETEVKQWKERHGAAMVNGLVAPPLSEDVVGAILALLDGPTVEIFQEKSVYGKGWQCSELCGLWSANSIECNVGLTQKTCPGPGVYRLVKVAVD